MVNDYLPVCATTASQGPSYHWAAMFLSQMSSSVILDFGLLEVEVHFFWFFSLTSLAKWRRWDISFGYLAIYRPVTFLQLFDERITRMSKGNLGLRMMTKVLGESPSISLFRSMFTLAPTNRGNFDYTYAFSGVDKGAKRRFKGLLSKVCNWKANFVVVWKQADIKLGEDTSTPSGFTTH